jgi:nucleoside-diphosphate-sugar epimerase
MSTAFVVGANGITGSYIIEHILNSGSTPFTKVVATSRRPPNSDWIAKDLPAGVLGTKLVWIAADLLNESINELAKKFGEAGVGEASVFCGLTRPCYFGRSLTESHALQTGEPICLETDGGRIQRQA